MLDTDRQPHIAIGDAGRELLFRRELRVRGRGRMDRQAARVADIGDVIEHLQRFDELLAGFLAAGQFEPDQAAIAAIHIGVGPPFLFAGLIARMDHVGDLVIAAEIFRDRRCVAAMLAHAQRQGFQSLDELEGVLRADRGAEIAQQDDAGPDDVGDGAERLHRFRPYRAVIALVRLVQGRLPLRHRLPVEIAAVDDHAADRGAMPADIFRQRVDVDRRAMIEGTAQDRRRRVVHDQRNAERAADIGDLLDREDVQFRVRQGFRVVGARLVVRRAAKVFRVGGVDKAHLDPLLPQGVGEQVPGAAIEIRRADHIVAGPGQVLQREG